MTNPSTDLDDDTDPRTATPAWEVDHDTTQTFDETDPGIGVRIDSYPVGRWFPTDRRRSNQREGTLVLYQRVTTASGELTVMDRWRLATEVVDDKERPRQALGTMQSFTRRWPTIASHPRPQERPALRRELRLWTLYFIDACAPDDALTLTALTAAMYAHTANKWAQSDIRSMFAQTQEMGLWTLADDIDGHRGATLTVKGHDRVARGDIDDLFHPDDRDPFVDGGDAA